ncbi:DUF58 domain-containing protein [Myxococcus sp. MISCRS1]|uniref:DUF58 domain-containing protein n=1 Tax=Myxococcus fulvus TaxID=33 RepID=A0A511SYR3_MYXFU|nr:MULTISPECIES: DUF58 domain-containing protein [Myxococcus]AKF83821.1 hypothetical protein MFUL124B02_38190 [Myxococcus fulvus 124B02]MBZ4396253.1 DUF58 domain-containing protein [Myxococcus sp. AS-1-15]MBZ4413119.1 DUF58 domain-containing protein [Myxococcus sp. XM-1-1-1]BDT37763.1 DUF58 domain-containing protein [Myxococcus sp. MH1]MCK8498763.1 DUF58 domain-containing protein [Myxococcus fulvus]
MLLDAQTLARLKGVKLRARAVMEGVLSGLHKSPHQGQSVEFAEHKEYAPGDELRHLDWKAYGKFDKYYVKRFEHETNLRAVMVVDASASMGYQSGALSKLEVATTLAGALSYLLVRQQDAAGLALLTGGKWKDVPPRASAGHLNVLLDTLDATAAGGTTDLGSAADHLAEVLPRRSTVIVLSDLLDEKQDALKRVLALRQRKNDVSLFHVVDPAELTFPFDDPTLFMDMEGEGRIEVNPREIKESYLEEFHAFLANVKASCAEADVDYELVRTDEKLDDVLLRYLARRGRRG